jgi:hypothetical protein
VPAEDNIPAEGWKNITVPANVGGEIFKKDKKIISAWFKKDLFIPADWRNKRIVLQFEGVADFATVFCNGKKLHYQEGDIAFDVDLTDAVAFGRENTICVFVENVVKGIILHKARIPWKDILAKAVRFRGHAYRIDMIRGHGIRTPMKSSCWWAGKTSARRRKTSGP